MSVPDYFEYKGVKYAKGTTLWMKNKWNKTVQTTYLGGYDFLGMKYSRAGGDDIVGIIDPVYYVEPEPTQPKKSNIFFRTGSGSCGSSDDVFHGFLLYLAVMIGGVIFKDRWLIWIAATVIYFNWLDKQ